MTILNAEGELTVCLRTEYEAALARAVEALKTEGFGVLTEIDVRDTLKKKLNVEYRPYKILGACNPPLAYRALTAAPAVGLLLPCNVTVVQNDDGSIQVSAVDPFAMLGVMENTDLAPIAQEARERLQRVIARLKS